MRQAADHAWYRGRLVYKGTSMRTEVCEHSSFLGMWKNVAQSDAARTLPFVRVRDVANSEHFRRTTRTATVMQVAARKTANAGCSSGMHTTVMLALGHALQGTLVGSPCDMCHCQYHKISMLHITGIGRGNGHTFQLSAGAS